MKIDGGCHCGSITYAAEINPERVSVCHCTDCQTGSGSAFRTNVPCEKNSFRLLTGEPRIYVKTAESGNRRAQGFCADCGTPLFSTTAMLASCVEFAVSSSVPAGNPLSSRTKLRTSR